MKVLVTGDRNWADGVMIEKALRDVRAVNVVEGECAGADVLAASAARRLGVGVFPHPADWRKHGRKAGPIRNQEMLDAHPNIELVLAFHDDLSVSRGTLDMIRRALHAGKTVLHYTHHRAPVLLQE